MPLRNEPDIIGQHRIRDAADELVDSVLYFAKAELPNPDEVREVRAAVKSRIKELIEAIRDHIAQTNSRALPPTFSPGELAKNLGITQDKVLHWIRSGKLEAIDVSLDQQGRPPLPHRCRRHRPLQSRATTGPSAEDPAPQKETQHGGHHPVLLSEASS
jgi:hypothetical protein